MSEPIWFWLCGNQSVNQSHILGFRKRCIIWQTLITRHHSFSFSLVCAASPISSPRDSDLLTPRWHRCLWFWIFHSHRIRLPHWVSTTHQYTISFSQRTKSVANSVWRDRVYTVKLNHSAICSANCDTIRFNANAQSLSMTTSPPHFCIQALSILLNNALENWLSSVWGLLLGAALDFFFDGMLQSAECRFRCKMNCWLFFKIFWTKTTSSITTAQNMSHDAGGKGYIAIVVFIHIVCR